MTNDHKLMNNVTYIDELASFKAFCISMPTADDYCSFIGAYCFAGTEIYLATGTGLTLFSSTKMRGGSVKSSTKRLFYMALNLGASSVNSQFVSSSVF